MIATTTIDREAIADHLGRIYKRRRGFACIATKDRIDGGKDGPFEQWFFEWPAERLAVTDYAAECASAGQCVYAPTSLFHTARRRNGETVPSNVLSFELDAVTEHARDLLTILGADLIDSGRTGHLHVNLYLERDLEGDELRELGESLARACDVGSVEGGKWGDSELLRVVGTTNTKKDAESVVAVSTKGRSRVRPFRVDRLRRYISYILAENPSTPRPVRSAEIIPVEVPWESLPRPVRKAWENGLDDASGGLWKFLCTCAEYGVRDSTALHWAIEGRDEGRFPKRHRDDSLRSQTAKAYSHVEAKGKLHSKSTPGERRKAKARRKEAPNTPDGGQVDGDGIYQPGGRFKLKRGSSVKTEKLYWLWQDRIPLGALSLLAGREGTGKSSVAYGIGAKVSRGVLNDGHYGGTPKRVIIYATEDAWETTIAPRLQAADADMNRVLFFEYNDGERLTLPNDNDGLSEAVRYNDVGLVIFDPIVSVLPDNVDAEKGQVLRRALEPINRIAADTRCAFLGIAHFNKRSEGDMGLLLSGSLVWSQVARATLGLIADPDNENGFFFLNGKNNNAPGDVPVLLGHTEEHFVQTDDGEETRTSICGVGRRS